MKDIFLLIHQVHTRKMMRIFLGIFSIDTSSNLQAFNGSDDSVSHSINLAEFVEKASV